MRVYSCCPAARLPSSWGRLHIGGCAYAIGTQKVQPANVQRVGSGAHTKCGMTAAATTSSQPVLQAAPLAKPGKPQPNHAAAQKVLEKHEHVQQLLLTCSAGFSWCRWAPPTGYTAGHMGELLAHHGVAWRGMVACVRQEHDIMLHSMAPHGIAWS